MARTRVRILLLAASLATLAFACSRPETEPEEPAPEPPTQVANPDLADGRHVFVTADGVEMPYWVEGAGEPTVVLVHCWMCDHSFWDAQLPVLRGRYRVITMDLPGHGEAGEGRTSWTVEGLGEDVASLIRKLDLGPSVLVGHSMGGPVSLKAAALVGDSIEGIVAVDTLHNADVELADPKLAEIQAAFASDFRGTCTSMMDHMFPEPGVDAIKAEVRRKGCEESNAAVGAALMQDFAALDLPKLFREAGVPIRAINGVAPNRTEIEVNRKYADFDAVLMEGVGHFPHMTRPDEFNKILLETLDRLHATKPDPQPST